MKELDEHERAQCDYYRSPRSGVGFALMIGACVVVWVLFFKWWLS
jgi:hypothetical protein